MEVELRLKLKDSDGVPFFGKGTEELLTLIDQYGSVRHASCEMGLSYTKAWKMLRGIEKATGKEAVRRIQGGKGGGKAELTGSGRELLDSFRSLEKEMESYLRNIEGGYFEKTL